MTFVNETRSANDGLKLAISAAVFHLMQRIENYRTYRKTIAELSMLNATQLADLGLHHGDITRAAREAVYGTRG